MAIPNEIYDPYSQDNYRNIKVALYQDLTPDTEPEPVVIIKPVVNTCAK